MYILSATSGVVSDVASAVYTLFSLLFCFCCSCLCCCHCIAVLIGLCVQVYYIIRVQNPDKLRQKSYLVDMMNNSVQ
jgi:hypothetical protein